MITLLLLTPFAAMFVLLALPARFARAWALAAQAAGPLLVAWMSFGFDRDGGAQFVERVPWIPSLGVDYHVSADGISILFLFLTAAIGFLSVLASWAAIQTRVKEYYALLLLLQSAMYGVFVAQDLLLFFVFFEFSLVPMYFLIGIWGGDNRLYAAIKFFLYTLAGSVVMLVGIIALYILSGAGTFDASTLLAAKLSPTAAQWIFWAFFIAFAVKVPMFPLHTWLPDAHTEAPTAGSVILAGVLLKMGTYGLLRFAMPLLPQAPDADGIVQLLAALSLIAILYGGLVSLMQKDWKRLIAYSSVSHMGFCTLGLFSMNQLGILGSVLQQVNHGITTSMLFLLVGIVYDQRHTREIADYGGLATRMPHFATLFAVAVFASAGVPLLNGFVGEFTILAGAFQANRAWAYWAVPGVVFAAAYLLWLYQRTMLGKMTNPDNEHLRDLNAREWLTLAPLAAWAILIGVYPRPYFDLLERPVRAVVDALR
jgi:NADH-quinone oxidoreductase subunit M